MSEARPQAIVIGASAGALEALTAILPGLPTGFDLPVMIVVHIPPDKRSVLADLFRAKCRINVVEPEDKEPICGGTAYFAPPDYHLLVEGNGTLALSSDETVLFSRPSIDVLFESAADAYGADLVGIVLTGANQDGAAGLRAVVEAGGMAIVQTPESAFASAMPEAAIAMCPTAEILSLDAILSFLQKV
ncbi:chemotaxis protein CheB [Pararhizobium sp. O133]|uniref:chemotaxis protein CheB n=1 Tax=Pararhizobium sp. O133 TaxID=3449278 RepID=UPI003F687DD7